MCDLIVIDLHKYDLYVSLHTHTHARQHEGLFNFWGLGLGEPLTRVLHVVACLLGCLCVCVCVYVYVCRHAYLKRLAASQVTQCRTNFIALHVSRP